jgi:MFS family permease
MKDPKAIFALLVLSFTITIGLSLPAYSQSSFLEQFIKPEYIGLYFAILNILSVVSMFLYPSLIRKIGNFKASLWIFPLAVIGLFVTGLTQNPLLILLFIICQCLALNLLYVNIDLAAETVVDEEHVGRLRSYMLTSINIAWLISPILMGLIAAKIGYQAVYLFAGAFILLSIPFLKKHFLHGATTFSHRHFRNTVAIFKKRSDLWGISALSVILQIFYCLLTLYLPLRLHQELNFSWEQIGVLFTIMLLPFVILQIPAGKLADKKWGEKEMMIASLIIMLISSAIIGWYSGTSFIFWMILLVFSKIGAAIFEAMNETYFFKKIHPGDVDLINFFRAFRPFGWLIGSLFAFIFLKFFGLNQLFYGLAIILFFGLFPAIIIKDTK